MKILTVLLIVFLGSCWKHEPDSSNLLTGKILTGTVISADGVFGGLEGYQFITKFSATGFETRNAFGLTESRGQYDCERNLIVLKSFDGIHPSENLEVSLKFLEKNSGIYEARYLSNAPGKQKGIFNLREGI